MCDKYGSNGTKLNIDIEELDKKGMELMYKTFKRPNNDDILRLKPLIEEIILSPNALTKTELVEVKRKYKFHGKSSFLFEVYLELVRRQEVSKYSEDKVQQALIVKEVKDWSGVANVTLFTSPFPSYTDINGNVIKQKFSCAYNCSYCPNDPKMPRSYVLLEPATLRAARNDFDAVKQMHDRMYSLYVTGHKNALSKIEVNVLGGTVSSYPKPYLEEFIRDIYFACNVFWDNEPYRQRFSLQEEKKINETTQSRIVQIVLETRPDCINAEELRFFRYLSVTRLQLGIQHTDDYILDKINRKCPTYKTINAIELCKSVGMKIDGHFMPNLPFASPEKDRKMLIQELLGMNNVIKREVKKSRTWYQWLSGLPHQEEHWEYFDLAYPELQVDQLKIYPCAVLVHTEIEKWYKEGTYVPYPEHYLVDILIDFKSMIFPWIRINRIMRDFYADNIFSKSGSNLSLRCDLVDIMKKEGKRCACIRCRECKLNPYNPDAILVIRRYNASKGYEYFISYENKEKNILYGFVRLRLDSASNKIFPELNGAALIREAHVYSKAVQVGKCGRVQHKGLGTKLMVKAEEIAISQGYKKVAVISSVGARTFYSRLGYVLGPEPGEYMLKSL